MRHVHELAVLRELHGPAPRSDEVLARLEVGVHRREFHLGLLLRAGLAADALDADQPARALAADVIAEPHGRDVPVDGQVAPPRRVGRQVLQVDARDVPLRAQLARHRRPRIEHSHLVDGARVPQPLERVRHEPDEKAVRGSAPRNHAYHVQVLERLPGCLQQERVEPMVEGGERHLLIEEGVLVQEGELDGVEAVARKQGEQLVKRALLQPSGQHAVALRPPPGHALQPEGPPVCSEGAVDALQHDVWRGAKRRRGRRADAHARRRIRT